MSWEVPAGGATKHTEGQLLLRACLQRGGMRSPPLHKTQVLCHRHSPLVLKPFLCKRKRGLGPLVCTSLSASAFANTHKLAWQAFKYLLSTAGECQGSHRGWCFLAGQAGWHSPHMLLHALTPLPCLIQQEQGHSSVCAGHGKLQHWQRGVGELWGACRDAPNCREISAHGRKDVGHITCLLAIPSGNGL